jgi:hypothetical protein
MPRKRLSKSTLSAEFYERMGKAYSEEARYWRDNSTQFENKSAFVKELEDKAVHYGKMSQHQRVNGCTRNQMKS